MNDYPNLQTALVSGAPYDWRASCRPERPYRHDYSQTLTLKLFLAQPSPDHTSSDVFMTFSQALENIRLMDQLTWGVPKIVYLVGWQYLGHDSQYPAWHQVNDALKRPCDDTALDSLLWLMREARHYHTVVSVHINMFDAYPNSPLWQTYLDKGLLVTEADGTLQKAGIWNGMQAYCVSYPREWDSGFAQKRIDEICSLLPLQEAGTVHLDAFNCREDPGHGLTLADSQAALSGQEHSERRFELRQLAVK